MNTISFLRVATDSQEWAAAFARCYEQQFRGALMDAWEQTEPTLKVFAHTGGELCLGALEYECSGSYLEEYCRVFRCAAAAVPKADYSGTSFTFSDSGGQAEHICFRRAGKKLHVQRVLARQPVAGVCPRCAAPLEKPVILFEHLSSAGKLRCPSCRRKLDPKRLCGASITSSSVRV